MKSSNLFRSFALVLALYLALPTERRIDPDEEGAR